MAPSCWKMTDQGLCNISKGLKNLTSLQKISLNFSQYVALSRKIFDEEIDAIKPLILPWLL